jgi:acetyltransferase AlgX (SGNH hydrolase-like protein)
MGNVQEEQVTQPQEEQMEWVSGKPAGEERRLDLPLPVIDDKVAKGKDGWLFLDKDSNDTMGQHAGRRLLTDHQVQQWQDLLEQRSAWLNLHGAPYFYLIAPDAHAVYADKLPDDVVPGATRPALQVLEHLRERNSFAPLLYPLDELIAERDGLVYPQTGSHWSEFGAFVGYRALMKHMTEMLPVRRLPRREIHLSYEHKAGDLGMKFDPPLKSRYVFVDVVGARTRYVNDNRVRNHGRLVEFQSDAYNALTCLVFGDSYAMTMMPLIAEAFARTYFAHIYFDYDLIRELKPDVVVTVAAERGMIVLQNDMEPGLRRLEADKLATGDVLPPRVAQGVRINSLRVSQAPSRPSAATDAAAADG